MLKVQNLAVARGGVALLEGVSFALMPGAALVLRGPNGAGKTTLLRTLAGLQPPLEGEVVVEGESLTYAAHADGLKAMLTVTENLAFWARVHGVAVPGGAGAVQAALEAMNLGSLRERRAADLSAGQKRRLGLARLMVTGRRLWLLDEPTVSLDAASVGLFAAMLRLHLAGGGAAVLATHIDLGLPEAGVLELGPYRAKPRQTGAFDEAFA
ncbi:heme ABC exporter ATP-binding protein CcmA [Stagnihabitans tardus]|uniref:Heme ABC exporter ATP-binding protein CcmA n=1 Tax=Stagnihabitans tardus TaxID=2699202 RepID=A0AAE4YDM2_9RHOB|nr:heme ABC exporter ATP-binding protein CcmA [Stagnihabitans tardus]NBZ87940.1 heme ABC exporter ATP-binding protein CcmA [Stagnihabitans tardus]